MPDYSGNSKKSELPEMKKVVKGDVTIGKKSEGKKFLESFIEEDVHVIGQYILKDVVKPTIKDLISSTITNSVDMLLYGDSARPRKKNGSRTSYDKYYDNRSSYVPASGRDRDNGRSRHSLEDVYFEERGDAEQVLDSLIDYIEQYGRVNVASYYSACDRTPDWPDYKWGWYNLGNACVVRERRGYIIRLPKPEPVE